MSTWVIEELDLACRIVGVNLGTAEQKVPADATARLRDIHEHCTQLPFPQPVDPAVIGQRGLQAVL
jgi:hypothetical protein